MLSRDVSTGRGSFVLLCLPGINVFFRRCKLLLELRSWLLRGEFWNFGLRFVRLGFLFAVWVDVVHKLCRWLLSVCIGLVQLPRMPHGDVLGEFGG